MRSQDGDEQKTEALADGKRQSRSMGEQAGGSSPSAKLLQALSAWILLPVKTVICLAHHGVKRWAGKHGPESRVLYPLYRASLRQLEGLSSFSP